VHRDVHSGPVVLVAGHSTFESPVTSRRLRGYASARNAAERRSKLDAEFGHLISVA
jgi:hypothetical protein